MTDTASRRARLIADLVKLGGQPHLHETLIDISRDREMWRVANFSVAVPVLYPDDPVQAASYLDRAEHQIAPLLAAYERGWNDGANFAGGER